MIFINIFTFYDFQPSFVTNYTLSGKAMPPMDAAVEKFKDALTQDKIRTERFCFHQIIFVMFMFS